MSKKFKPGIPYPYLWTLMSANCLNPVGPMFVFPEPSLLTLITVLKLIGSILDIFQKALNSKKKGGILEEYLLLVPVCVIKILMVWRHSEKVGGRISQDDGSTTTVWLHSFDFVSSSIHKVKSIFCKQTALEQYKFFYQRFIFLEDIYLGIHVHVPS